MSALAVTSVPPSTLAAQKFEDDGRDVDDHVTSAMAAHGFVRGGS